MPMAQAQHQDEGDRGGDGDEELGGVDAADRLADVVAPRDQRAGDDRAPAPAAEGVDQRADEPERGDVRRHGRWRELPERLGDDHDTHHEQVQRAT